MSSTASENTFLPVKEGSLYWQHDTTDDGEDNPRPTIILIHAGVANNSMWDAQVDFLIHSGWNCLRYDLLGFGRSYPSDVYLHTDPREPFDYLEHLEALRHQVLGAQSKVFLVGLSIGASLALAYTIAFPEHVHGLALISGGLRGFDFTNDPREDALSDRAEELTRIGDARGAAMIMVCMWGDGPLQEPGRLNEDIAEQMLQWNIDISARECARTGGMALPALQRDPPPIERLHEIKVPTAVAYGTYDESFTKAAMSYVATNITGATLKEFQAAHMVNLELPDEFNAWLSEWLDDQLADDATSVSM